MLSAQYQVFFKLQVQVKVLVKVLVNVLVYKKLKIEVSESKVWTLRDTIMK